MDPNALFTIKPARTAADLIDIKTLFRKYASDLGFDLSFQNFDAEMLGMPGKYAPPRGELLLAKDDAGVPIGCVGVRPLEVDGVCEMKRLYVVSQGRGTGVGYALVNAVIQTAEHLGYGEMRLDSLPSMNGALKLYHLFGFVDIEAYYQTPMEGTRFLSLKLHQGGKS